MAHMHFTIEVLERFCNDAFEKFGFSPEEAATITDVLLLSDKYGIESHGMQRLSRYHKGIESGMIKPDAKPEIVFESPVSAVIDGHDGMGQIISRKAMELAIEKAKKTGAEKLYMVHARECTREATVEAANEIFPNSCRPFTGDKFSL
jgi:LDH2 family malate/lactate/ureidoglycolate dehydrogenase